MRKLIPLVAMLALLATPAGAAQGPKVTVQPSVVSSGDTLKTKGTDWAVIEFCEREVALTVKSAQNAFPVGTAHISLKGRFKFRYDISAEVIGPGNWKLQAKQRCESGEDGSPNPIRRSAPFKVN